MRKRDQTRFLAALEELPKKMLLLGHTNYLDTCYALWDNLHQDEKREVFDCDAVVPLDKLSKKARREYHAKQRGSWYGSQPNHPNRTEQEDL